MQVFLPKDDIFPFLDEKRFGFRVFFVIDAEKGLFLYNINGLRFPVVYLQGVVFGRGKSVGMLPPAGRKAMRSI
jgi:hypothetical protein